MNLIHIHDMGIRERKNREKNLRRQQIQEAAKELFLSKGFNGTAMEDIAKKAELSPATIYLYFKNKEELYVSINLITLQYLFAKIKKIYDNERLSVMEKILRFKNAMYSTYRYDPLILRNIMHVQIEDTLLSISKELVDKLNNLSQGTMTMIANVYEKGVLQGEFRNGHGMAHADIMWGMFTGLVMWEESRKKFNPKKDFLKSTLDKGFDVFCRGIKREG
jgi:AcrR family transcriptional regulator